MAELEAAEQEELAELAFVELVGLVELQGAKMGLAAEWVEELELEIIRERQVCDFLNGCLSFVCCWFVSLCCLWLVVESKMNIQRPLLCYVDKKMYVSLDYIIAQQQATKYKKNALRVLLSAGSVPGWRLAGA